MEAGSLHVAAYIEAAQIQNAKAPLFQTLDKLHRLSGQGISRPDLLRAVKQHCTKAGQPETICNHTFRVTGITAYLKNGDILETAQYIANHESPRTTKPYDRRKDLATLIMSRKSTIPDGNE